ncbi:putative ribosomal protein S5 domain 2-type [Plasmopara halstedii]
MNLSLTHVLSGDEASICVTQLSELFKHCFCRPPAGVARAPGRVNLIGEHVDYEGYSVLPMAIDQSIHVAFNVVKSSSRHPEMMVIRIMNAEPQYEPVLSSLDGQKFEEVGSTWAKYVLCGVLGLRDAWPDYFNDKVKELQMLVDGSIPAGCGLSSSSALVVASALATSCALQIPMTRLELAELCTRAEQRVGTMGGGMDQAVACLAQRGVALHLNFLTLPARSEPVVVPSANAGVTFVVANSLVVAKKAVDAAKRYNKRVVECALASKIIAKKAGLDDWSEMTRLVDVQLALKIFDGEQSFNELKALALTFCPLEEYTIAEIEGELEGPVLNFFIGSAMEAAIMAVLASNSKFKLHQRALHVWGEAERVKHFKKICASIADETPLNCVALSKQLQNLGEIMTASHKSCQNLYECSCPELNDLVDVALSAGALGARLTGAGWGGCIVALVRKAEVINFTNALQSSYYMGREISSLDASKTIFETNPAPGANVFILK